MPPQHKKNINAQEARINLALQAVNWGDFLSIQLAALTYNVPRRTLIDRRARLLFRRDWKPTWKNLTSVEEEAIIQHILQLDEQGFPPTKHLLRDMANALLAERNQKPVGKNWVDRFLN